jgi:aryl-alcohol dehydrogenase-like predicted oxidoreductase
MEWTDMDYRYLGRSAPQGFADVSGRDDVRRRDRRSRSQRIIDKAFAQGINFIDTADVYHAAGPRKSSGAPSPRGATAGWSPRSSAFRRGGPEPQGQSRKWIIQSAEASLRRLGTDYIDILYFHRRWPMRRSKKACARSAI